MNICLYAFGSSPLFAKEFINRCFKDEKGFKFYIILEKGHYINLFNDKKNIDVLYLNEKVNDIINEKVNINELNSYPSNIFKDIETEKKTLKRKDSKEQLKIAVARYRLIKAYLKENTINHILYMQHPENFTSLLIGNVAKEIGINISVPIHTRNLDTSFFSNSCQEVLPDSIFISDSDINNAKKFLEVFKSNHISSSISQKKKSYRKLGSIKKPSFFIRVFNYLNRLKKEKQNREFSTFYIAFVNNFTMYRNLVWKLRKFFSKKLFNIDKIEDLPKKYIYYPLQYSPESSINVPAPYYIDQMRIIDALRMNMPNDMSLVVKEHPSCAEIRPLSFVRSLLKKAGVFVVKYDLDSREIIEKSTIVVSVSGTAAFEAFLLNKPSFVMSQTFFDSFIGGVKGLDDLNKTIMEKSVETIDDRKIIKALSHIFSVSDNFYGLAPSGFEKVVMTEENLDIFYKKFLEHIEKE